LKKFPERLILSRIFFLNSSLFSLPGNSIYIYLRYYILIFFFLFIILILLFIYWYNIIIWLESMFNFNYIDFIYIYISMYLFNMKIIYKNDVWTTPHLSLSHTNLCVLLITKRHIFSTFFFFFFLSFSFLVHSLIHLRNGKGTVCQTRHWQHHRCRVCIGLH
jgi:hypothetical protein